jgi:hypothetical protein
MKATSPPHAGPPQHNTDASSVQTAQAIPWWTIADQAELDTLVHAFVDGFYEHRERCALCVGGGRWCDDVHEAFDALESWLVFRYRLSKAEWIRRQYDELALILDGREAA